MPVLPLIDLMILLAWTSLIVAFVEKAMGLALATRPSILGMGPFDFVLVAAVCLLFALGFGTGGIAGGVLPLAEIVRTAWASRSWQPLPATVIEVEFETGRKGRTFSLPSISMEPCSVDTAATHSSRNARSARKSPRRR